MYTVFGASTVLRFCLIVFAVIVLTVALFTGIQSSFFEILRWSVVLASAFMILVWVLIGWSGYYAPWRWAFRNYPILKTWLFPDLNGVWYGTTQSNWSVIKRLRDAAARGETLDLDSLATVPLWDGFMAMDIKANLFRITIASKLSRTGGASKTLFCRAGKHPEHGDFNLSYLYLQGTPEPESTDESSHDGAAILGIEIGDPLVMRGEYWNRRSWREGSNAAGMIEVRRVSDRHAPKGVDLLEHARGLSEATPKT